MSVRVGEISRGSLDTPFRAMRPVRLSTNKLSRVDFSLGYNAPSRAAVGVEEVDGSKT